MRWLLLILAIVFNSAGNILIKKFSKNVIVSSPLSYANVYFIAGLLCFGINVILYAKALEGLPLGTAYPILVGLSIIIVSAASVFLFNAHFGLFHVLGMALILTGATILVRVTAA